MTMGHQDVLVNPNPWTKRFRKAKALRGAERLGETSLIFAGYCRDLGSERFFGDFLFM